MYQAISNNRFRNSDKLNPRFLAPKNWNQTVTLSHIEFDNPSLIATLRTLPDSHKPTTLMTNMAFEQPNQVSLINTLFIQAVQTPVKLINHTFVMLLMHSNQFLTVHQFLILSTSTLIPLLQFSAYSISSLHLTDDIATQHYHLTNTTTKTCNTSRNITTFH